MTRPLKFKTVEELQEKISNYLNECGENKRPLTITGLALYLDTTRDLLLDYQEKDEFSDTIKRAKLTIQNYVEEYLFTGKNIAGAIFNLVNNYGWTNKSQTDVTSGGEKIQYNLVNYGDNKPSIQTETIPDTSE